jgi:hypothetical protein
MSLGEGAEVGALVLAMFVIALGPLLSRVRRHRRELDELKQRLDRAEGVGELVCTTVTRGLVGVDNTLDWSAGIVHRLMLRRDEEIEVDRAIGELRTLRVSVERAVAEVRLLAGDKAEQVSALQQLTYRLGDSDTVDIFGRAADLDGFAGVSKESLRKAERELRERLIHRGREEQS